MKFKLLLLFLAILMFFWITQGEFNRSPWDIWLKINDFYDHNWQAGGWHRAILVFGTGLAMWLIVVLTTSKGEGWKL